MVTAFENWSLNENVYAISCANNLKDFALIVCLKHLKTHSFLGKFNVPARNLDKFLTT